LRDRPPQVVLFMLLLAGSLTMAAQQGPAGRPSPERNATGVLRGRVVHADTGEPLRRVQIRVALSTF
jgi:hypothetical protein